jgi:hypothetical protein
LRYADVTVTGLRAVLGNSSHPGPVPGPLGELLIGCYNACAAKSMSVSTTSAWVASRREIAIHRA